KFFLFCCTSISRNLRCGSEYLYALSIRFWNTLNNNVESTIILFWTSIWYEKFKSGYLSLTASKIGAQNSSTTTSSLLGFIDLFSIWAKDKSLFIKLFSLSAS